MSAHHLNVNRASCRGATYRVAGQASGALAAHFLLYWSRPSTSGLITSSINIVDTEPTIAETVDVPAEVPKSHVPAPGPSVH